MNTTKQNTQTASGNAPKVGDNRIKAFLLRHGFAIPTDEQMSRFPLEFRNFNSSDRTTRYHAGVGLLAWMAHNQKA